MRISAFAEGETLFGTFYPRGYIVAVFRDPADLEQAVGALQQVNCEDVRIWTGQHTLDRDAEARSHQNALQKLGSLVGSGEKLALDDYLDLAREGRSFLTAHVHDQEHAEQARS